MVNLVAHYKIGARPILSPNTTECCFGAGVRQRRAVRVVREDRAAVCGLEPGLTRRPEGQGLETMMPGGNVFVFSHAPIFGCGLKALQKVCSD